MRRWTGMTALTLVLTGGRIQDTQQRQPQGTIAPTFTGRVDSVHRDLILAYAQRLRFDTTTGAHDVNRLAGRIGNRDTIGPIAEIASESRAYLLRRSDFARGRIIARLRTSGPWRWLGLPAGVTYLWADSVAGTGFRFVLIPRDPAEGLRVIRMRYEVHGAACARGPSARLVSAETGGGGWVWVQCGCLVCCCVRGGECEPIPPVGPIGELPPLDSLAPRIDTLPVLRP